MELLENKLNKKEETPKYAIFHRHFEIVGSYTNRGEGNYFFTSLAKALKLIKVPEKPN